MKILSGTSNLKLSKNIAKNLKLKLIKLKVKVDQINRDTFAEKTNFFSYRRSCKLKQTDYGRCISAVRLL